MTKPDYGKEHLELKIETNRIKEERDFFKRGCHNMEAKYNQKVQDCARIEKEIAATQRKYSEAVKRLEQYHHHAGGDAKA